MYQSRRDETILLSLYDGGNWSHTTRHSTNFSMEKTKLTLGGLTQNKCILEMFNEKNSEKLFSGLYSRFTMYADNMVFTPLGDLK